MSELTQEIAKRCLDEFKFKHPEKDYLTCVPMENKENHFLLVSESHTVQVRWEPEYQTFMVVNTKEQNTMQNLVGLSNKLPKPKGKVSGFLAMLLTVAYAVYIISYFGSAGMESVGGALASMLVAPHMLCVAVAAVFSLVGVFGKKRWAVLTAGILMAAAAALFPTYAMFVVVQAVLFFVSYARMRV